MHSKRLTRVGVRDRERERGREGWERDAVSVLFAMRDLALSTAYRRHIKQR